MFKLLLGLLGKGNGNKSVAGGLAWEIREAIKGLPLREFVGKGDTKSKKAYLCPTERIKNNAEFVYEVHS